MTNELAIDDAPATDQARLPPVFRHGGFLLLMTGSLTAFLGEQLTTVALPWLVLKLSSDSAALGLVLAAMALPKILFLVIAGVLVDRHSPRMVLICASAVGVILLTGIGVMALYDFLTLWMMYLFACGLGLVGAFAIPARVAILSRLIDPRQLQSANAILMGATQISLLGGPLLAGLLATLTDGLGLVFLLNACCFLVAALTVPRLRQRLQSDLSQQPGDMPLLATIVPAAKWLWSDKVLKVLISYWAVVNLLVAGPVQVGLPLWVDRQLGGGASAFGMLIAANGLGQLIGIICSGLRARKVSRLGVTVCLIDGLTGMAVLGMGFIHRLEFGLALMIMVGIGAGYVQVGLFTWIQRRIPNALQGRVLSLLMLILISSAPLSALIAGYLIRFVTPSQLFIAGGAALSLFAMLMLLQPALRQLRD
ncbi:MFS transporter [Collimonas arenae]|uniref:MFS transporter n=1 Tax=Collimonas arenae TaxID=279058 RepID=UPI00155B2DFA|nr:MFS transporter [Collimonas arenae]